MHTGILNYAFTTMTEMALAYEQKKADIRYHWRLSKTMPRKKKKRVRKELNLDWYFNEAIKPFVWGDI